MSLISLVSWLKRCESDKGRTQARGGNCKDRTLEVVQIYGKIQVARTADGRSSSSWFCCRKRSLVVRNHLVNQKKRSKKNIPIARDALCVSSPQLSLIMVTVAVVVEWWYWCCHGCAVVAVAVVDDVEPVKHQQKRK